MKQKTIPKVPKPNVLIIYKHDQGWQETFKDLNHYGYNVVFVEEATFNIKNIALARPSIIIMPLTLAGGLSFIIARRLHLHNLKDTKILLCSNTDVRPQDILNVFDGVVKRTGIDSSRIAAEIKKLSNNSVVRVKDEPKLNYYVAYIIVNEGYYGPENHHGEISVLNKVFNKDESKSFLKFYLSFLLITMICTFYSSFDSIYKQMTGASSNDLTAFWLCILPSVAALIFGINHHSVEGYYFKKHERIIYFILGQLWVLQILYFILKHVLINSFPFWSANF